MRWLSELAWSCVSLPSLSACATISLAAALPAAFRLSTVVLRWVASDCKYWSHAVVAALGAGVGPPPWAQSVPTPITPSAASTPTMTPITFTFIEPISFQDRRGYAPHENFPLHKQANPLS